MANAINYAVQYSRELAQAFPYVLNFGALYATPNNGRYRVTGARTIEIPHLSTTGRVDADRDTLGSAARNYDNAWETKTLGNQRKWSTLVHPADIDQTNQVATIANITKVMNEEQKFPEMDAYTVSQLYKLWTTSDSGNGYTGKTADTTALTSSNVLTVFDNLMLKMDEARVPVNGRILYVPYTIKTLLKQATQLQRTFDVKSGANSKIDRTISRIEEVEVIGVPSDLMKTKYTFTTGWAVDGTAKQINMLLVHPSAVITPVSYQFAQLSEPTALSQGKYVYYEESFEDVFILNHKADAIQFNVDA